MLPNISRESSSPKAPAQVSPSKSAYRLGDVDAAKDKPKARTFSQLSPMKAAVESHVDLSEAIDEVALLMTAKAETFAELKKSVDRAKEKTPMSATPLIAENEKLPSAYDSDAEPDDAPTLASLKMEKPLTQIIHRKKIEATSTTLQVLDSEGKRLPLKGNQIIGIARDAQAAWIKEEFTDKDRDKAAQTAHAAGKVTIKTARDWLSLEGVFNDFPTALARPAPRFEGEVTIELSGKRSTTVMLMYKSPVLYSVVADPVLKKYLRELTLFPSKSAEKWDLSYFKIVEAIAKISANSGLNDAALAKRQLALLKGEAVDVSKIYDRFLAYFNAVLFGNESSRNSLSFTTGLMTLELISLGKLSYEEAFQSPAPWKIADKSPVKYAAYPMASPYAGAGNFVSLKKLTEATATEAKISAHSYIGMRFQRKYAQHEQIPLKEAMLMMKWFRATGAFNHLESLEVGDVRAAMTKAIRELLAKVF